MSTASEQSVDHAFRDELISCGHFLPSGEPGLYGRGMEFETVRNAVDRCITRLGVEDRAETPRFPPIIPRRTLEAAGYLKSFPQLCGSIHSFRGDEPAAIELAERARSHQDWSQFLSSTDVVLVPAACYPAYPAIGMRGPLDEAGVTLDLGGCYVFRNEPSHDPARLQMFHQRELVRIGEIEAVLAWRENWMERARGLFIDLGLDAALGVASDAFFGRGGKLLARSQREQRLKFEVLVPIAMDEPTAVASFNFHQDHFGTAFQIKLHDGRTANSACVGFGLERITLALFKAHGLRSALWPDRIRAYLFA